MSDYTNASLILPQCPGVKPTKLYSLKPTDGTGDFTVARNSTATYTDENGVIQTAAIDVARINYIDGEPSLLTEPQSTNLYLNNAVLVTQNITTLASTYTVSFYGTGTVTFTNSFVGSLVGTGANDRVSLTFTATAGTLTSTVSGTVENGQCENLGYATSVIFTTGSSVTRLGDVINNAGDSTTFNSESGTLYMEIKRVGTQSTHRMLSISDGTVTNELTIFIEANSNNIRIGTPNYTYTGAVISDSVYTKIAVRFSNNNWATWVNGIKVNEQLSGATYPVNSIDRMSFARGNNTNHFYSNTKAIKVFKTALTDAQLQTLTTP